MKNRYIIIFFAVHALTCLCVPISAQTGASCSDPIEMGRNYSAHISGPDTIWYMANTFDLPLTVKYYPGDNKAAPDLYLDFSCTSGVYDDSIICSLFCTDNAIVPMPYHITPTWKLDENNNPYYEVSMGEWYRNVLLEHGISYNVEAYIKTVYYGVGDIEITPDADFSQCMETEDWLLFGRELPVEADDDETFFIAPYANWADDSVRYIWQGSEPAVVVIGTSCKFDPMDDMDDHRIDVMEMQAGNDTVKHTNEDIAYYMTYMTNPDNTAKGGIFYVKVLSEGSGTLKVERIPATPPGGGAILLKYGEAVDVYSNDTSRLYAIPRSWVKDLRLTTPTDHVFRMYVGTTPDFYTTEAVAAYKFDKTDNGHELRLFAAEMSLLQANRLGNENYLYIRFQCAKNTTVKPMLWTPSDCEKNAKRIRMNQKYDVARNSTTIYSLYYEDIRGGDMTIAWSSMQSACSFYFADTCFISTTNVGRVFYTGSVPKNSSTLCPQTTIDSWLQYVDPDGYVYVLFSSNAKSNITIRTNAPEEIDPSCDTYDSIQTVTAWDSFEWRGTTYTASGDYSKNGTIDPVTECMDSVFTLHLTVHTTTYDSYEASGCDSIVYQGKTYTAGGEYVDTIYDAKGDRTIVNLHLAISYSTASEMHQTACGAYEWRGTTYTESGVYRDTIPNKAGCDSVMTLYLTVGQSYNKTLEDIKVCDSYVWGDTVITKSGTYTRTFKSVHGCDSIVTQTITIGQSYLNMVDEISAYDSYTWIDGFTYKSSIYGPVMELSTVDGCDSLIILNLTIRHLEKDTVYPTVCASELPYVWYGEHLNEGGMYSTDTLPGVGTTTDTVHTLVLTVNPVYAVDTVAEACDAFIWRGTTYTESGDYPYYAQTKAGCDSTVTLHLTIHQRKEMAPEVVKACDSYEWHGVTYTKSGIYKDTLATAHQCDSVCVLDLTVGYTTYGEWTEEAYDSYTSPQGITYTESGDYTEKEVNATDCDSIITLHLTIHTTTRTDIIESGCDSIIIEGVKYTESIARIDTIVAPNGDREIKTLNLTIGHTTYGEWTEEACEIYISPRGITYTESGDYIEKEINATGCDSVITLHLTLYEECAVYDTVYYCRGFNTPHDERVGDGYIRCYRPYVFESPSTWDYMDGVILSGEPNRTLIDFNRAEANLRDHYTDALTPVERIAWSVRHEENGPYVPVVVEAGPQWIEAGKLAVQIHFRCGEIYNTEFPTGLNQTDAAAQTPIKRMENGQLIIIRGDAVYSPMGQKIK